LTATSLGDTNYYSATASQVVTIYKAPGAVSNGMTLWLRADNGVSPTTGNVSRWDDQSQSITNSVNQATPAGGASTDIVVTPTGLNYGPVLTFSGASGKEMTGVGNFSFSVSNTIIAVARNLMGSVDLAGVFVAGGVGPGIIGYGGGGYSLDASGGSGASTANTQQPSIVSGIYANNSN
jgi:hypothetical protein